MNTLEHSEKRYVVAGAEFHCIRKGLFTFLDKAIPVLVMDIGPSGLRAVTKSRLTKGQTLVGRLVLGEFAESLPITGQVAWIREYASADNPFANGRIFGLSFTRMKPEDRAKLSAVIKLASWKIRMPRRPAPRKSVAGA